MLGESGLNFPGLLGPVVVANNVHIEMLGIDCIDLLEETQELLGPLSQHALQLSRRCICVTFFALAATNPFSAGSLRKAGAAARSLGSNGRNGSRFGSSGTSD